MKRVIFYIEPEWAFGVIHHELAKYLHTYQINCRLLPWNKSYTLDEMRELDQVTDLYVTTPHGWRFLGYDYRSAPPEKCVIVNHSKLDMIDLMHYYGTEDFNKFYKYSSVSKWLQGVSKELGILRESEYSPLGINYDWFFGEPSDRLTTLGYGGTYHGRSNNSQTIDPKSVDPTTYFTSTITDLKRSYLVKEIAEKLGLNFKVAQHYHNTYVTMPGYYRSIDCLISPSTEEGAGLPVLEAGAAGKLVIGTPVGHWNERIKEFGGIEAPIPENEFVEKTTEILSYYIAHPKEYRDRCYQIREHAKTYDWSHVVNYWVDLLK